MNINRNVFPSIPSNIYVGKEVLNNKKVSSENIKVVDDKIKFNGREEINEGKLETYANYHLDGVFEGETLRERDQQSINKFLFNLTNVYAKEKNKIETTLTGKQKDKQLEILNKKFDNTVNTYSTSFEFKLPCSTYILSECGYNVPGGLIKPLYDIRESVIKLGNKAKEYIDSGNKAPTNAEEFEKFSKYVSQGSTNDSNNLSLDTLSKFDEIATNMLNDGRSFEGFNLFLDNVDLPDRLKNILREASFSKIDIPYRGVWANAKSVEEITTKYNENKKYFESLLYSMTERQKENGKEEEANNILNIFNNLINLFSKNKTDSEKYTNFIQEMKIKKLNDSLLNSNKN